MVEGKVQRPLCPNSPISKMNRTLIEAIVVVMAALVLAACKEENTFAPPPPPQVDVQQPIVKDVTVYIDFPAKTEASSSVEIRARVQGLIKSQEFEPGQYVKKGQLLVTIEPEQYEAAVAAATGRLAKARADLEIATTTWQKKKNSFEKTRATSEIDVLSAEADRKAAAAQLDIAISELADATRNLGYTKITSPISGRASWAMVDRGGLVSGQEATLLTTVVQDDPVHVNFDVNERDVLPYLANRPSESQPQIRPPEPGGPGLRLTLSDGTAYPGRGEINFVDNAVDPGSGTMRVSASFENGEQKLAGGLFVRIGIPQVIKSAVLVPRHAIQRDLGGTFVLVIGADQRTSRRVVVPTQFTSGNLRILEPFDEATGSGLKREDQLIVGNLQRVRAGVPVVPVTVLPEQGKNLATPEGSQQPDPNAGASGTN